MKKENKPGEYAQEREHEALRATSRQITETRSSPANTACENKTNIIGSDCVTLILMLIVL